MLSTRPAAGTGDCPDWEYHRDPPGENGDDTRLFKISLASRAITSCEATHPLCYQDVSFIFVLPVSFRSRLMSGAAFPDLKTCCPMGTMDVEG